MKGIHTLYKWYPLLNEEYLNAWKKSFILISVVFFYLKHPNLGTAGGHLTVVKSHGKKFPLFSCDYVTTHCSMVKGCRNVNFEDTDT